MISLKNIDELPYINATQFVWQHRWQLAGCFFFVVTLADILRDYISRFNKELANRTKQGAEIVCLKRIELLHDSETQSIEKSSHTPVCDDEGTKRLC